MSLQFCILASGSSGNCTVVRTPNGVMLIDAGIGPRTITKRLAGTGVSLRDISAICLTHLDSDHFRPNWIGTMLRQAIRLHCHASRVDDLRQLAGDPQFQSIVTPFEDSAFEPIAGLRVRALPLAHDEDGSHGFVIEGFGTRAGWATDLGRVPPHLIEQFEDLDVLALESNYDPKMQRDSSRPWFLKQRIMGGRGHLSNEQALEAIRTILDRSQRRGGRLPRHIVLLHRSRQCNCPHLVRKLFASDIRIAERLTLAEQFDRTEWLGRGEPAAGEQLALRFEAE